MRAQVKNHNYYLQACAIVLLLALSGCLPMDTFQSFELNGRFPALSNDGISVRVIFEHKYNRLLQRLSERESYQANSSQQFTVTPSGQLTANFSEMSGGFLTPAGVVSGSGPRPYFAVELPDSPGVAYVIGTEDDQNNYQIVNITDRTVLDHRAAKWILSNITWEKTDHGWRVHVQFTRTGT